jgi:hypothetical protein
MKYLVALALVVAVLSIQEIQLEHRERTPLESQRLLNYMRRTPEFEMVHKVLGLLVPHVYSADIYSYPEVKIYNYMDAQYYG